MTVGYIVQDDPAKNFVKALDHVDQLVTILDRGSQVTFNAAPTVLKMRTALNKYRDGDFIIAVGDPVAIGIACAVVASLNGGRVALLKWDRQERRYFQVAFDISPYRKEST